MSKEFTKEEVIKLCQDFFYEGMTYEQFIVNNRPGGPISKTSSPSEHVHMMIQRKIK